MKVHNFRRAVFTALILVPNLVFGEGFSTLDVQKSSKGGITTEAISITPLGGAQPDAIGILTSEQTGIPTDFWGSSDPSVIADLIAPYYDTSLPEITALWQRISLSEIDAPVQNSNPGAILAARVDHLLNAGALDQAEALLSHATASTPALFQQSFDVGLLTGRAQSACAKMLRNPSLSPGMKARVFCLARENDWTAAALTLTTAKTLGEISEADAELLARFLDPELFDESNPPPAPTPLTALDFIMREALAIPRSGQALPLAFLHQDLERETGWRNQVIATERLVRSQALPPARLIALYQDGKPAASGGIWVRVSAVQKLLQAIQSGDTDEISNRLSGAYRELSKVDLEFVLAEIAADQIHDVALTPQAGQTRFYLWLLHADYKELSFEYEAQAPDDAFLKLLAIGDAPTDPTTDIQKAITAAFSGSTSSNSLIIDAQRGRLGASVLKALTNLIQSRHRNPVDVETSLATLLLAGLEDEARRIAIQILLHHSVGL